MNREAIYSALFNLVSAGDTWEFTSRRVRALTDVKSNQFPALFQNENAGNKTINRLGTPTIWMLYVDIIIYSMSNGSESQPPALVLNPLIDAVTNLFAVNALGKPQTLGGLVTYARVDGKIEIAEGVLENRAAALIPIEIMTQDT